MSVRVEEIDARTAPDEVLRAFADAEHACHDESHPGEPPRSVEEIVAFLRFQPETHTSCHWLAPGGAGHLYVHGATAAFAHVLVLPDRRRAGVGTALAEAILDRCRELEVRAVHGHHTTSAGAAFTSGLGATDNQRIVHSVLALPDAELPEPSVPDGWQLATWLGRVPDEHLDAYVVARAAMDDAPDPAEMEFPAASAEHVRSSEESLRRRGREMRLTVTLRDDGEIGAFTELRVTPGSALAFTDDSGTAAPHRGLGLMRAAKLEALRRLRDDRPEIAVVTTDNAEENTVMRHINESVGFRPTVTETTATLVL